MKPGILAGIELIPLLIAAAVFISVCLAVAGVYALRRQRSQKKELIDTIKQRGSQADYTYSLVDREPEVEEKNVGILVRLLGGLGRKVAREKQVDYTHSKLTFMRAGIYSDRAPAVFLGAKLIVALILPIIFLAGRGAFMTDLAKSITFYITIFCAFLGFYIPVIWLRLATSMRKQKIIDAFPDSLDLLVVCLEAGMGLDSSISRVSQEMELSSKAISQEFKLYNYELMAGQTREIALRNLSKRIHSEDVDNLITLLIQADRFGTSITKTMKVYSDTFRLKRATLAEEMAAKLPVKLVFPLVLFIFPSLFVIIIGPAAIKIYDAFIR